MAGRHDLVTRAHKTLLKWFANEEDALPEGWKPEEITAEFTSHGLVFEHAQLEYPYIDTRLTLFRNREEVGHYRLITSPAGDAVDDYLVFF